MISRDIEVSYGHVKEFYDLYKDNGKVWFDGKSLECFLGFLKLKYKHDKLTYDFINSFHCREHSGGGFITTGKIEHLFELYHRKLEVTKPNLNKELIRAVKCVMGNING